MVSVMDLPEVGREAEIGFIAARIYRSRESGTLSPGSTVIPVPGHFFKDTDV